MGWFEKLSVMVIVVIICMILAVAIHEWTGAPLRPQEVAVNGAKGEEAEPLGPPEQESAPLGQLEPVSLPGVAIGTPASEPSLVRPTARMPREYIKGKPVTIGDLAIGQGGWVSSGALLVADEVDEVWLVPSEYVMEKQSILYMVFIRRDIDGFSVDISNLPVESRRWPTVPKEDIRPRHPRVIQLIREQVPQQVPGAK